MIIGLPKEIKAQESRVGLTPQSVEKLVSAGNTVIFEKNAGIESGFLDEELFFEVNAQRKFPVTDIIRKSPRFDKKYRERNIQNDEGYTPEPDIFHDIQAHTPFLMDDKFADFLADEPPLDVTYPLPERLTLPDALAALIPVARDLDFVVLLTNPLPDLVLGFLFVPDTLVAVIFLVPVPLPVDIVLPTFFFA